MSSFVERVAQLPEDVRKEIVDNRGFTSEQEVADSVTGGAESVEVVFAKSIAESVPAVKQGHPAWSKVIKFFRDCYNEVCETDGGKDAGEEEVRAKDPTAEEFYELSPAYRRKRLDMLKSVRLCEVDDTRLPSDRLWGRVERLRRVNKEFQPIAPDKIQSVAAARRAPARAALQPGVGGVLSWRLPAIQEAPAATMVAFEDNMFVVENTLFLTGWIQELRSVETFHARFWARIRRGQSPGPGFRPLSIAEMHDAYGLFQRQWARASRDSSTLDEAILTCLPPDSDELDGRLALAPRMVTGIARDKPGAESGRPRRRREDAAAKTEPAVKQEQGMSAAKATTENRAEKRRRLMREKPCKFLAESGTCRFGDKCWYKH
jgi:hypothetical protein